MGPTPSSLIYSWCKSEPLWVLQYAVILIMDNYGDNKRYFRAWL